jgi:hypothetical protein
MAHPRREKLIRDKTTSSDNDFISLKLYSAKAKEITVPNTTANEGMSIKIINGDP